MTNPDLYRVILENDRVRVLAYEDQPGDRTTLHEHPDSVMYTLSAFRRRLYAADGAQRDVELAADTVAWLPAQQHAGHNIRGHGHAGRVRRTGTQAAARTDT